MQKPKLTGPVPADVAKAMHKIFTSREGVVVLDFFVSITTNEILGANATDAELRYKEGMRAMTALISQTVAQEQAALERSRAAVEGKIP